MESFIKIDYVENVRVAVKSKNDRMTDAVMTPNEYVRLVGRRARDLKIGARPVIDWDGPFDPIAIAKAEINSRKLPLVIIRKIPDARSETRFRDEVWEIKDMDIRDC